MLKDIPIPRLLSAGLVALIFLSALGCKEKQGQNSDAEKVVAEDSYSTSEASMAKAGPLPTITPVAHATAVLDWEGTTIYVDPTGGKAAFENFPLADLILITDIHGDHFNPETLEELETAQAKIIVPQAVADQMPGSFTPQLDVLDNGDMKERYSIEITAIPMYNLREEALGFHEKGRGNGYVLEREGRRVYISGDTEDIPEMRSLEDIDIAMVCMNLPYTMTVESAADAVVAFKPVKVYPYHYRGRPDVSDVEKFAALVKAGTDAVEVVQLDWYPGEDY